ncbi:Hydrogen cyanide synthase subunit HcnC precursor [Arthrobacter saudimassiliensis]|uniref:Hydrogen cyanide synthase subunit HcnC n=1 Tax=Arthrobacter saudimassiliensis TaxID=1461584 RepID=A0A078MRX0_9MICC|nr:Hydrogen cyanide synthase subunit HcnC precursor [Arthrobacter saudimassiliensis]
MDTSCDILVIGGGIAGLSLASELAERADVVVIEAEPSLAYHTSSRSARQLIPSYGPAIVQALTIRTLALVRTLEADLPQPLLTPRSFMLIGDEEDVRDRASGHMHPITAAEAYALAPELRAGAVTAAGLDTTSVACDTKGLLDWHIARIRDHGGRIRTGARAGFAARNAAAGPGSGASVDGTRWVVQTPSGTVTAGKVVNAAGAWADDVGRLFGARRLGLQAYRRTAAIVDVRNPPAPDGPMVADAADRFYYRPFDGRVLISPAESEPSIPMDALPRASDVNALITLIDSMTTLDIAGVEHAWTGLRTEAPDGVPVAGYDADVPGFFWLAGQGGYGFQTSSALAEFAAHLLMGDEIDPATAAALAPTRAGLGG